MSTIDIPDLHPPDDYSHRFFIWHEWIMANGPLNEANVFDYFTTSMFYDKQSNNQVLRMQTMHTGVPLVNEAEELKRFTGIEFAVVHAQPPSMFIIHKRERLSPDEVRPLAAYFIMNNRIYQSPDLYTVLSNRLLTSLNSLQSTLETLRRHRPDYLPRTGFIWPIDSNSTEDSVKRATRGETPDVEAQESLTLDLEKDEVPSSDSPKKQQNSMLLLNAMRTTAGHSKLPISTSMPTLDSSSSVGTIQDPARQPSVTPNLGSSQTTPPNPTPNVSSVAPSTAPEGPTVKAPPGFGKKKKKRTLANITA